MNGEETEIDRNVVDALYEPMVHMIRNSVDHGIEPMANRRDRILEKAIGSGLVSENDPLTDAQIYELILQPGFSTAQEITDVSGRR